MRVTDERFTIYYLMFVLQGHKFSSMRPLDETKNDESHLSVTRVVVIMVRFIQDTK